VNIFIAGHQLIRGLAHFDEYQATESASTRSLRVIAIEMMQNSIPPEADEKLVLKHPERWSPEASNFIEVTSWGTLKDLKEVRSLETSFLITYRT
jgi:hypothetical protein